MFSVGRICILYICTNVQCTFRKVISTKHLFIGTLGGCFILLSKIELERSTFWKREDRKALQHWANRLYRIVLISWKDAVKIKWNEKDVANSAHINFSDNKHFIRDYNNIELHPTVLSCGSVVQDSLCEHVDAMGCGINENSNEIIPNLLKLTWDKNELISEVADPLLMMNFDEAKRNCLAPEFTYSKENNADSVLHEHMPKWIVDEITKLEVARERDLRGNFVKDPLRVNSFDADESLSSLKPDFSEYLSMPSEQSKSNIEKKNNFKQDGSEVAYGVEFDLNENDPLSMTMNPLAVKQIHDKLNSLKATLMRANQEKEANRKSKSVGAWKTKNIHVLDQIQQVLQNLRSSNNTKFVA